MEFLIWLVFFGGLAAEGALMAFIIRAVERRKARRDTIYYVYQTHIEKSSDVRRRNK